MAKRRPRSKNPAPTESCRVFGYALRVTEVEGRGFIGQGLILEDATGDRMAELVGTADLVLDTREQAEDLARRLAREWIDESGSP